MPDLPFLSVSSALGIYPEPLTTPSFAPFGTAIISPLPPSQSSIPTTAPLPPPLHPAHQPDPVVANQSTAFKYSPISPLTNNYAPSSNPQPQMSMFSCFPRRRLGPGNRLAVKILERHPFTTQTFCPLGLASGGTETYFLVIVAPSLEGSVKSEGVGSAVVVERPPDLKNLRAFVAHGGQAVTYAPGTWHAPMVVLGERRVDFVVMQFVNGVPQDDCQEVGIGGGVSVLLSTTRAKAFYPANRGHGELKSIFSSASGGSRNDSRASLDLNIPEDDPSYYTRVRGKLYLREDDHYIPTDHGIDARVLRTCRQIYEEGSVLLYSNHQFMVGGRGGCPLDVPSLCRHFLNKIGQRNVELIRALSLPTYHNEPQMCTAQEHVQGAKDVLLEELLSLQPGLHNLDTLVVAMVPLVPGGACTEDVDFYMEYLGAADNWPRIPTTSERWQFLRVHAKKINEYAFKWTVLRVMRIIQLFCPALTNVCEVLARHETHAIFTRKPLNDNFTCQKLAKELGFHGQVYALEVDVDSELVRRATWEDAGFSWTYED